MEHKELRYKDYNVEIKGIKEDEAIIEATFSTNDVDRHGEVVVQSGWDLKEFSMNPVILWGHDHSQPAIGKAIEIGLNEQGNLWGKIKFAVKENPLAKTIYDLFKGGYMRAFSVGYYNEKYDVLDKENEDGEKEQVEIHLKNKLYEISAVNVGANALALAKQKGINIEPIEKAVLKPKKEEVNKDIKEEEKEPYNSDMSVLKGIIEKEGRVLSSKNKKVIQDAIEVLNKLLQEDKKTEEDSEESKLLENKDRKNIRVLNKTIRILVNKKKEIKKGKIKILRN